MKLTIRNLLENTIGTRFHLANRLIVEHDYIASDCDRCTCERQKGGIDILLPEVTDEVNGPDDAQWLKVGLRFALGRVKTS